MYRLLLAAILALSISATTNAAEFEVCQAALPTSNGGTVDCTVSGFGTPKGAMAYGGFGTVNGTAVSHAGIWVGFYDGTNQTGIGSVSEDNLADSAVGFVRDTNSALVTVAPVAKTQDGDCTLSFITDGVRFTCADAPPAAYRMNVVLIGGNGVSNVFVGSATGHATQNSSTAVSAPGFTPDILFLYGEASIVTSGAVFRHSFGIATNESGIVQRAMAINDSNASASMVTSAILSTNRIFANGVAASVTLELTSWDVNGFTVTTRDAATGPTFIYMAIKLNGISAKLVTDAAPAGTGSESITGIGWRPQFGFMMQGEFAAVNTLYTTDDGEVWGISAFTSNASASAATSNEDGNGTSDTASITGAAVCQTVKDGANYSVCTFTQWTADGVDLNHTTNVGGAKQRAILFVQASTTRRRMPPIGPF